MKALDLMAFSERRDDIGRHADRSGDVWQRPAVRAKELNGHIRLPNYAEAFLVNRAMVPATE